MMKKVCLTIATSLSFIPFLDASFIYGTATITWNKEAAERFAAARVEK